MSDSPPDRSTIQRDDEVAGIDTDPWRWFYGQKIPPDDHVLASRGAAKGVRLYDELWRDPQVATGLSKRIDALLGREWEVLPGDDSARATAAAERVTNALGGLSFNQAIEKLLRALLTGVSVVEVMWGVAGDELRPVQLLSRDPRRFIFRVEQGSRVELRLLTRAAPAEGEPVPGGKFIVHRHGQVYENPWGLGLGHRLWWPVFFKRQGIGFWLSAVEKFAQPTALGRYPVGTPPDKQDDLLKALGAIASEAGVIVPEGMAVELLEAKRSGAFDSYEAICRYMDGEIIKTILGETLTTDVGASGSRALGGVHNEIRLEITKGDADRLADTLNGTLVRWITDLNDAGYAASGLPYPKIWWDVSEPEDLAQRADRDLKVYQLGFEPTEEYMVKTYGDGFRRRDAPQPAPQPIPPAPVAEFLEWFRGAPRRAVPAFQEREADGDAADALADQLDTVAQREMDRVVDALRAIVANAATLEEVRDRLLLAYPSLPTSQLAELMGQALTVAALAGRSDLADRLAG